ncbi:SLAM family member 9-like isoform X2 [Acipenser ruthenus]|uniref:SLAM family member 9-like isoform X2 n=1 Tax=Acipenser ruthenus TaxID=7906 RepID=UPI002742426E|nr:SLAM family member 9-like isoform X2 [Acipenser ruthenus]
MKDLLLTVLLHCLISGTGSESNPTDRYGLDGESFHLDVEEYNNLTFRKFVWSKNTKIITEYNLKTQDIDYYKNEEKMEFDKKTFSLLIKKLENTDSGLYRAETVQDDGERIHVVTYKLRVQAAVPKPMINLTETLNANETCIVTLNCSVEYRDDVFIYWEETGINNTKSITNGSFLEYTPVPSAGDEESFTCYAENRVSKNATIIMKNKLTCSQPGDAKLCPELKPSQTEPKTKLQKRGIAGFSNLKVEDSVNTTYATVGETNQSTSTQKQTSSVYDLVRKDQLNQPTDLPPDNKTIYASVQKTSIESNCSTTIKKSKIR